MKPTQDLNIKPILIESELEQIVNDSLDSYYLQGNYYVNTLEILDDKVILVTYINQ